MDDFEEHFRRSRCSVLGIDYHGYQGRGIKDILGGPKGWKLKKKVAKVEIYLIFEGFFSAIGGPN